MTKPEDAFGKDNIDRIHTLHQTKLVPPLMELDVERAETVKHHTMLRRVSALIGIPALAYSIYGIAYIETRNIDALLLTVCIFLSMTALMVVAFFTIWPAALTQDVQRKLTNPVINALGYNYSSKFNGFSNLRGANTARQLGLFKKHDYASSDEFISGERSGFFFEMLELELVKIQKSHQRADGHTRIFWGQCFFIQFDKPFHGTTVATRRSDFMSWRRRPEGLSKVRIESRDMRRKFRLSSSDQVEARYLITPDILERLDALERRLKGKKLRFGFHSNHFVIVLEKANLFDPNPYKNAYASKEALNKVLDDMAAIATLFDTLAASHKRDRIENA